MEVPDNILYLTRLLSSGLDVGEAIGEYAAKISVPGAVISGCNVINQIYDQKQVPSRYLVQKNSALGKKSKRLLEHHHLLRLHFLEWLLEDLCNVKHKDDSVI